MSVSMLMHDNIDPGNTSDPEWIVDAKQYLEEWGDWLNLVGGKDSGGVMVTVGVYKGKLYAFPHKKCDFNIIAKQYNVPLTRVIFEGKPSLHLPKPVVEYRIEPSQPQPPPTKIEIWTGRVGYKGQPHEIVLDTTAKSGFGAGKVFAPTWDMVRAHKNGVLAWQDYVNKYYALLRDRYANNPYVFESMVSIDKALVLLCYCPDTSQTNQQCHRYLLVDILSKVARHIGIEPRYMGEKT